MNKSIIICLICSMALSMPYASFAQGRIVRPSKRQTEQTQTAVPKQDSSQKISGSKELLAQKFHWDEYGICQDQIVDLGLSVKWAGWNIGASAPEQPGQIFGWGDPSGQETVADLSKYPTLDPPKSICGDSRYDMATVNWGKPWRLPNKKELKELMDKCTWIPFQYKGSKGAKVTGTNGNTIFMPISKVRFSNLNFKTLEWSDLKTYFLDFYTCYYSGDILFNDAVQTDNAYNLTFEIQNDSISTTLNSNRRCFAFPVRAVYAQ
ncbi:MAG: hypothetical protein MR919_12865 [Parabacteroides sp.]|nr:hypothetical protein [Parabacteroides sp.]